MMGGEARRMGRQGDLAARLAGFGLPVLVHDHPQEPGDLRDLLRDLACSRDPRIRAALIALWLARPDTAQAVPAVLRQIEAAAPRTARRLRWSYQAAVYLQREWRHTIPLFTGEPCRAELPDLFGAELGLPGPDDLHGRAGLMELADLERAADPRAPYDPGATYESAVELLRAAWLGRPAAGHEDQGEPAAAAGPAHGAG